MNDNGMVTVLLWGLFMRVKGGGTSRPAHGYKAA